MMTDAAPPDGTDPDPDPDPVLAPMPRWITAARPQTSEEAAFFAGAALDGLDRALRSDLPTVLLRERLALRAAAACLALSGRPEREAALRDALTLLRPGDQLGPAGTVYMAWHRAVTRAPVPKALATVLEALRPAAPPDPRAPKAVAPVPAAARALEAALAAAPRAEAAALILADAALARALGWDRMVPLLGTHLTRRDLHATGGDLDRACHRALVPAVAAALRQLADLAPRAARLRAAVPGLRAKGAGQAAALFLQYDALAPTALVPAMSDRAARRFCERLETLGLVRELTGRATFRLYGL